MKQFHLIIQGRVQGVFFRAFCRMTAKRLSLAGWVKNLPDGSVEAVAQGDETALKEFVRSCKKGPILAHVESITFKEEPIQQLPAFEIRH